VSPDATLTVIVCSFNGERKIGTCLDALAAQTVSEALRVIVVDDGSKDRTAAVARDHGVEVISHPRNLGLSAARNTGLEQVTTAYVAFTDDDCLPEPHWVERLQFAWTMASSEVTAIGGLVVPHDVRSFNQRYLAANNPLVPIPLGLTESTGFVRRASLYLRHQNQLRDLHNEAPVASLVGANMSFRVTALREIGGFDAARTFGGDESYVCHQLRERYGEETVHCVPSVLVAHDYGTSFRDTLRRSFAYGTGLGRNWVTDGGVPSVRPLGAAVMLSLPAAFVSPLITAAAFVGLPLGLEHQWLGSAARERRTEYLLYPWLVLAQEFATNVGFAVGLLRARRARRARRWF
jgi:GT2 family glycosyltransferase